LDELLLEMKVEDIADNFDWDPAFANDFAGQIHDALDLLKKECERVIKDCHARKKRLDHALIWGSEEEDLTMLAA
jgi:hypothetical protein